MREITLKFFLFTVGILFFTGGACPSNDTTASDKIAQTEIYQSYLIAQNGQNYDVTAYFRVGGKTGTTLALSAPSKIVFNGQAMQEHLNTSSGTFYTVSVPGNTPNGTFAFTDRKGKIYTNNIDLSKVGLKSNALRVNGTVPISIPLSRPASDSMSFNLEMNDQTVFVESTQDDTTEAYFDKTKNSIIILPAAWKKISKGNVAMILEVRNDIPTQQGTALGGNIEFTYNTTPLNIALIKGKPKGNNSLAKTKTTNTNNVAQSNSKIIKSVNTNISVNQ